LYDDSCLYKLNASGYYEQSSGIITTELEMVSNENEFYSHAPTAYKYSVMYEGPIDEIYKNLNNSDTPFYNIYITDENLVITNTTFKPDLGFNLSFAKETFDKQYELLENDFASLIGLKYKGIYIGFNYFFHFQKTVVYASGADDPEYENSHIPIYHVILWTATLYYKENGFDFIQYSQPCGYNLVNGFDDYLDKKQVNISHFKRGMGTTMVPLFRGIKYYNNSLLIEDIEKFKNQVKIIDV
jgi:hypothetical protein